MGLSAFQWSTYKETILLAAGGTIFIFGVIDQHMIKRQVASYPTKGRVCS